MPETISWSVDVSVGGGPTVSAAPSISVAAYDKLSILVDAADNATAQLQPDVKDNIELLMITASRYHAADLSYTLGGETISLDRPQLFTGGGMMSLFAADPEEMVITNDLDTPVTVSILVGRSTS